ncbi:MAG: type IIA DNA topoisomerase subunit B, partial [Bacteroidetes bacterium]
MTANYTDETIRTLDWKEHIRKRPGMYIGKLGDGSSPDDGIYILLKEVIDNSIDEFMMGFGKTIEVTIDEHHVTIRDYGRGIPLGKVVDVASKMNTGAKYDSKVFKKSVGLNGVGIKAVNALSSMFTIESFREGKVKMVEFNTGDIQKNHQQRNSEDRDGTRIIFEPDPTMFGKFNFINEYVEAMLRNYTYLNTGLTILYNGHRFSSKNGLLDLLQENMSGEGLYPVIHLKNGDIEVAIT